MMNEGNIINIQDVMNLQKENNDMKRTDESPLQRFWRRTRILVYLIISMVLGLGITNYSIMRYGVNPEDIYIGVIVVITIGYGISIDMFISAIDVSIQKAIRLIKHDNQMQKERHDKIELLRYIVEEREKINDGKETA